MAPGFVDLGLKPEKGEDRIRESWPPEVLRKEILTLFHSLGPGEGLKAQDVS